MAEHIKEKMPEHIKKDLIALFKDIKYCTGYMTDNWSDTDMLSRMAREDKISPWSIESEVDKFLIAHNIKL